MLGEKEGEGGQRHGIKNRFVVKVESRKWESQAKGIRVGARSECVHLGPLLLEVLPVPLGFAGAALAAVRRQARIS